MDYSFNLFNYLYVVSYLIMKFYLSILIASIFFVTSCGSKYLYRNQVQTHIVRKGETLFSIGWRYGESTQDIARWNGLGDGSLIFPGQILKLYGTSVTSRQSSTNSSSSSNQTRSSASVLSEPIPNWSWPTEGRVNVNFGDKPGIGTGVLINGEIGQDIYAAASGLVVYAGSGLIGYGNLIILEHNKTYLSAYGYSESLLVKEGDSTKKGQKIATMGEGPEQMPRLHFEIRQNGKPVNPKKHLPKQ